MAHQYNAYEDDPSAQAGGYDINTQAQARGPSPYLNPAAHPGSAFGRLRQDRQYTPVPNPALPPQGVDTRQLPEQQYYPQQQYQQSYPPQARRTAPTPPVHRRPMPQRPGHDAAYMANTTSMVSDTTQDADNYSRQAGGGLVGIAEHVADHRPRESGMQAAQGMPIGGDDGHQSPYHDTRGRQPQIPPVAAMGMRETSPMMPAYGGAGYPEEDIYNAPRAYDPGPQHERSPYTSPYDPTYAPRPPPSHMNSSISGGSLGPPSITVGHHYAATGEDMALARYSQPVDPDWQVIDPNSIADDGDNGLDYNSQQKRASVLSFGRSSDRGSASNGSGGTPAAVVGAGAVAGGLLAGGLKSTGSGEAIPLTGPYGASSAQLSGGGGDDLGYPSAAEKREWAEKEAHGKKRRMWIIIGVLALIIIGAVAGSVAGVLLKNNNDDSPGTGKAAGGGQSADEDTSDNGDLGKDSAEIKKLLGNPNLHKVFPGIDYTPMYTQYPDCLGYPPSQNNVTRDIAIISQMTNVVRLYGTDCNQTEMTLHAIDRLGLKGKMKVWLGVWQDKNATTNARQLKQMYSILDTYGPDPFLGAIVGNEVIFREDLTVAELITELATVKSNFSALGYDLPVATSDLGDKWTAELARTSDLVMANVHPFFTGMPVADAAEFTWQFWQNKNWALNPDLGKNYIAETGWPTKGGTNCGQEGVTACEGGSVAGVAELNEFMEQWVCPALANGTNYFWFEAFDEPWKIKYNEPGKEWEDQWGILDVNRNIKKGVTIPDCGGKTVPDL